MRKCTFPKVQQIAFAVHHFSSLSSVQQEQRVYEYTFYLPLRSARSLIQSALTESHLNDNITVYKVVPRGPRKSTLLLSGIRQHVPFSVTTESTIILTAELELPCLTRQKTQHRISQRPALSVHHLSSQFVQDQ